MAKVVHLTLMLELDDDAPLPEDWECWPSLFNQMPGVAGFSIVSTVLRPFLTMEDDPVSHTQH